MLRPVLDLKRLDDLARGDTLLHRLDARAKVLVTLAFIGAVVSCDRLEISGLLPFYIFPAVLAAASGIPPGYLIRKVMLLSPLLLLIGMFNPVIDRQTALQLGTLQISEGWLSLSSILLRGTLTISAAFILIGTTGFNNVCGALERLGLPRVFAMQLNILYRYLFVVAGEGERMAMARALRAPNRRGFGIGSFAPLAGHLLLRTWERAERVHLAMLSRGFNGQFPCVARQTFGIPEIIYMSAWLTWFIIVRLLPMTGGSAAGVLP